MKNNNCEKRADDRKITEKYYSVQLSVKELAADYRFKLYDISASGLCILVREDSEVLKYLNTGDTLELKYYPHESPEHAENLKTRIRHITKNKSGGPKEHFFIGLEII